VLVYLTRIKAHQDNQDKFKLLKKTLYFSALIILTQFKFMYFCIIKFYNKNYFQFAREFRVTKSNGLIKISKFNSMHNISDSKKMFSESMDTKVLNKNLN
jgi:lipopolysaccharide/colanic/teichoic acid biosynthesis glycosyltransferase